MNKELIKYIDKHTWCEGYTCWNKNREELDETKIVDINEEGKLYTSIHRLALMDNIELDNFISEILRKQFDTKLVATYILEQKRCIVITGLDIRLENRVMGNFGLYNMANLNGIIFGDEVAKVKLCENEDEAIQKILKGKYETINNNHKNFKIRDITNVNEIKHDIELDILAISNSDNVLKNKIIEEMCKQEEKFINNLIIFEKELKGTKDYIGEHEETNKITLKEVGGKYSVELANIMFDLGYAGWFFEDTNSLEQMKEQMKQTLKDDYDLKEILDKKELSKENVFNKIEKIKLNLLPIDIDKLMDNLENKQENEELEEGS